MRLDNVIRNIKSTVIVYFIKTILQFIVRLAFVKVLPIEYLGINGLFTNILAVLSLSELGIGPAIVYSLYRPLAKKDIETIKSIMLIFERAYICIGIIILSLGVMLTPWLDYFIKDKPDINNLNLIYLLFVFDTAISYFYSYKRSLLIADQRQSIANFYQGMAQIILGILQCIFLFFTHSFWSFIILKVCSTLIENIAVARKTDNLYSYILEPNVKPLSKDISDSIIRNVKALFFSKMGGIIVFSTTNIILSKYVGIAVVGLYSNYLIVINALNGILGQIYGALTASIGNLDVTETSEKKVQIFKVLNYITAWISCYFSIGLYLLLNRLIELWLGKEFLLDDFVLFIIVFNFYISIMRKPSQIFEDAMGLFWQKRFMPIPEIIINIIVSVYGAIYYGIQGALLGVAVSTILVPWWFEPYIVLKNGIKYSFYNYYKKYFYYIGITAGIACFVKEIFYEYFNVTSYIAFFSGIFIITLITNLMWLIFTFRMEEFKYLKNIINFKLCCKNNK